MDISFLRQLFKKRNPDPVKIPGSGSLKRALDKMDLTFKKLDPPCLVKMDADPAFINRIRYRKPAKVII